MTPTSVDTMSSPPQPMGRVMFGPEVTRFAALRKAMEDRWIPEMQSLLSIADHDLPLLWDADFLFRARKSANSSPYVLCEINASSVAPFQPIAVQPVDRKSVVQGKSFQVGVIPRGYLLIRKTLIKKTHNNII